MVWVGTDLKGKLVPAPQPQAGTPSTRPGCSKTYPAWPWTLPGRGIYNFSVFRCLTTFTAKNFFLLSNL